MNLTESGIIEKYAQQGMHCMWSTILPYEYEWTCVVCRYNVVK